jgi:hypothetical protein
MARIFVCGRLHFSETLLLNLKEGDVIWFSESSCAYIFHYKHMHACIGLASFIFLSSYSLYNVFCIPDLAVRLVPQIKVAQPSDQITEHIMTNIAIVRATNWGEKKKKRRSIYIPFATISFSFHIITSCFHHNHPPSSHLCHLTLLLLAIYLPFISQNSTPHHYPHCYPHCSPPDSRMDQIPSLSPAVVDLALLQYLHLRHPTGLFS